MKTTIQATLFSICVICMSVMAKDYDRDLETCINGAVSSSGLFSSQGDEDRFIITRLQTSNLDLESCINGAVSESGLFPSQEAEDQYYSRHTAINSKNDQ